jgi:hypothetical protein
VGPSGSPLLEEERRWMLPLPSTPPAKWCSFKLVTLYTHGECSARVNCVGGDAAVGAAATAYLSTSREVVIQPRNEARLKKT